MFYLYYMILGGNIMKSRLVSGIAFFILGILISLGPLLLFPVCGSMGDSVGKCFWTARAELGLGAVIAIEGLLLLAIASKQVRFGLSVSLVLTSALVFLIPNALIGICDMETMSCHAATLPALNILSILTFAAAILNSVYLYRSGKNNKT